MSGFRFEDPPVAIYRFDVTEVFIRRGTETGEVILSRKSRDWSGFRAAL
ncbi:hypothetical protein [Nitrospirillum iridis]|nr:hypothetical protein [Nitrospirillum iridis]